MSDYTQSIDFSAKDALPSGTAAKAAKGADLDTELALISTAIASKVDESREGQANGICNLDASSLVAVAFLPPGTSSAAGILELALDAETITGTDTARAITPANLKAVLDQNAGIVTDFLGFTDTGTDRLYGWDETTNEAIQFTLGDGLTFSGTTVNLADAVAGAGLAIASSVLSVGVTNGLQISGDSVGITNQAATASVPVSISSGTLGFALGATTQTDITLLDVNQDSVLVSDNGTLKLMPLDAGNVQVQTFTVDDELDATHTGTFQLLTGSTAKTLDIPSNGTLAYAIGTQIIVGSRDTAALTVSPNSGVTLTSYLRSASDTSGDHTVLAGGMALLTKVNTNEWMIIGNIS